MLLKTIHCPQYTSAYKSETVCSLGFKGVATFQDFLGGKKLAERKSTTSMVESSDETLSTGEGSGKPCQYSCLMAEQKDTRSSSPSRTPELQLTAAQLLTRECWIPPKNGSPHPRAEEKPQQDGRKNTITFYIKSQTFQRQSEGSNKTTRD